MSNKILLFDIEAHQLSRKILTTGVGIAPGELLLYVSGRNCGKSSLQQKLLRGIQEHAVILDDRNPSFANRVIVSTPDKQTSDRLYKRMIEFDNEIWKNMEPKGIKNMDEQEAPAPSAPQEPFRNRHERRKREAELRKLEKDEKKKCSKS